MADEMRTLELEGKLYWLPFEDAVPAQTVEDEVLAESIRREGMIYPIVYRVTDEGREIIDGHTRARLIAEGFVELDEVPLQEIEVDDDEAAFDLAIELNFQRRQISPEDRRLTIGYIHRKKGWRGKPSSHVKELSELLGVSRATISNDIAAMWPDQQPEKRQERQRINHLLTALNYLDREQIHVDLSDELSEDAIAAGERYLSTLRDRLRARREEIKDDAES